MIEQLMSCLICKHRKTRPGVTTLTFTRDALTLVVKNVPAQVCENCGEAYVDEATATQLLETAETAAQAGVQVEVREYVTA